VEVLPSSVQERLREGGQDLTLLVVRLGAMGDILRTLPAVRLIRTGLPACRIVWIADDRWADLLQDHPDLNGAVRLPRREIHGLARNPLLWGRLGRTAYRLRQGLRAEGFDVALDFHGNLRSGVVVLASGARVRIGYAGHQQKEGNRLFTTHRVSAGERRTSRIERNLDLVRALGVADHPLPDAGLPERAGDAATAGEVVREAIGESRPYAVLNPGASALQAYKKPPAELLAAAAGALRARGIASLVVHGPSERDDAVRCVDAARGAAVLAPPTGLPVLASVLRRARLFVGGDSGPLHLACAVGCPVVGIYGPTDPVVNAPWGVPYEVVSPPGRAYTGIKRIDRESGGFSGIRPETVAAAVTGLISRLGSESAP
jgi:ADP-heptose:LPS heptosyltransferase